ncbi:hypothetical protein [Microbacterium sp. MMO-10]|uniref:hypothetical protein n=1 Tax=Microbacterium sp. MMO-10 TaxID=3081272 RepID=UPI0030173C6E
MTIIYGGTNRYEVQWRGASGNWWYSSTHRQRWVALLKARLMLGVTTRVIDHGADRTIRHEEGDR